MTGVTTSADGRTIEPANSLERHSDGAQPALNLVIFHLGTHRYGFPTSAIREVLPLVTLVRPPECPDAIAGIVQLRGTLLVVVDLRTRLGLPRLAPRISQRIIVADVGTQHFGLLVDGIDDLVSIENHWNDRSDGNVDVVSRVARVGDQIVILLNPLAIVDDGIDQFRNRFGQ